MTESHSDSSTDASSSDLTADLTSDEEAQGIAVLRLEALKVSGEISDEITLSLDFLRDARYFSSDPLSLLI